jgi:hypothetical protein
MRLYKFSFFVFGFLRILELLKFAKRYHITDSTSRPSIDVGQASYFSPASTATRYVSSQGYHSLTPQACGSNRFQSVIYQRIGLSFNSSMVLPCVPLVPPPQRRKMKGSVNTVTTCRYRVLKTQMFLPCFARFCYLQSESWVEYCKVLPRTSRPAEPDSMINSFEPRQELRHQCMGGEEEHGYGRLTKDTPILC